MTLQATETAPIPIAGLAHIGIRVHDLERSVRFDERLGSTRFALLRPDIMVAPRGSAPLPSASMLFLGAPGRPSPNTRH